MPFTAQQLKDLWDAGPGPILLGMAIVITLGLWRGIWVPGFIARRDQAKMDIAEAQNLIHTANNATLTAENKALSAEVRSLKRQLRAYERERSRPAGHEPP
jgi:cell division protein FtsB